MLCTMGHHAYLISGRDEESVVHARELLGLTPQEHIGNPDVHILTYELLGIADARMLQSWASQRPLARQERLFIIRAERILYEAQNTLLKLFEEPPLQSRFALIVPRTDLLLPTLRSRFQESVRRSVPTADLWREFMQRTLAAQMTEIAERTKAKDIPWVDAVLASCEAYALETDNTELMRAVLLARRYSAQRGASLKMLLEHVALSCSTRPSAEFGA